MTVVYLQDGYRSLNDHRGDIRHVSRAARRARQTGRRAVEGALAAARRLDKPGPHGSAREVADLRSAARRFVTHPRPPVLLSAVGTVAAARLARGRWARGDAAVAAVALVAQPFVEWAIHREVLHALPGNRLGDALWRSAGYGHAQHHADPASLDTMFLRPPEVVVGGTVATAVALLGSPRAATGALCVALGVLAYDWTHFVIHTAYQPKTRLYRRTWRNHRLHHFRNERYWLGVTSPVADAVLRTEPRRDEVGISPLAARRAG